MVFVLTMRTTSLDITLHYQKEQPSILTIRLTGSCPLCTHTLVSIEQHRRQPREYISCEVDQSPGAALSRTILQLPDEAEFLLQGRVRIITYVSHQKSLNLETEDNVTNEESLVCGSRSGIRLRTGRWLSAMGAMSKRMTCSRLTIFGGSTMERT